MASPPPGRPARPPGAARPAAGPIAAALREAREETGIESFTFPIGERILAVDVHPIPAHGPDPAHSHYDIPPLFPAPESLPLLPKDCALFTLDHALAELVEKSVAGGEAERS